MSNVPMPMQPQLQSFTTWVNPTDRDVVLDLHTGASPQNLSGRVRYIVPANGEQIVPAEFDLGIHDTRDGVIVGGLGPQLRRKDKSEILHSSLDADKAAEREAAADAEKALIAKQAAEQAMMSAVAKQQAAAAAISATAEAAKPKKS
jgi:hypothetical protein